LIIWKSARWELPPLLPALAASPCTPRVFAETVANFERALPVPLGGAATQAVQAQVAKTLSPTPGRPTP
jgi:hypothetical protein